MSREEEDYWAGPFCLPSSNFNPRLSSLIISILDICRSITPATTTPSLPLEQAAAYIMSEIFGALIKIFNLQVPEFGPPALLEKYGHAPFDELFAAYYSAFGMEIVWATRPNSGREGELPLITRKTVHCWLRNCIAATPSLFCQRLNGILHDIPELVDPLTEAPFLYKELPSSCFPVEPVPWAAEWLPRSIEGFSSVGDRILASMRPVEEQLELARVDLENAREEARMHRRLEVQEFGGWRVDASENRTWQGGSQW